MLPAVTWQLTAEFALRVRGRQSAMPLSLPPT
jgi:hypothetical protein